MALVVPLPVIPADDLQLTVPSEFTPLIALRDEHASLRR
jgi:hypothetical protein